MEDRAKDEEKKNINTHKHTKKREPHRIHRETGRMKRLQTYPLLSIWAISAAGSINYTLCVYIVLFAWFILLQFKCYYHLIHWHLTDWQNNNDSIRCFVFFLLLLLLHRNTTAKIVSSKSLSLGIIEVWQCKDSSFRVQLIVWNATVPTWNAYKLMK